MVPSFMMSRKQKPGVSQRYKDDTIASSPSQFEGAASLSNPFHDFFKNPDRTDKAVFWRSAANDLALDMESEEMNILSFGDIDTPDTPTSEPWDHCKEKIDMKMRILVSVTAFPYISPMKKHIYFTTRGSGKSPAEKNYLDVPGS